MRSSFVTSLVGIVGESHVLTDPDVVVSFGTDWTGRWSRRPLCVVRPESTREVAAVVAASRDAGVSVVPQGGNTGLVGGSVPHDDDTSVVLSTRRLSALGEVERVAGGAHVVAGAGVTLAALHRYCGAAGLRYGVDLASRDSATVGGTVATNAGGLRVCRYGDTSAQVVGLEAVLPDGSVASWMSGIAKDGAGYRLPQLLIGSEGTLAVITAARLRLHPVEDYGLPVLVGCPSVALAQRVVAVAAASGPLQLAEIWDGRSMDLVQRVCSLRHPLTSRWPWYVLVQVDAEDDGTGWVAQLPPTAPTRRATALPGGHHADPEGGADPDVAADPRLLGYRERLTEAMATLDGLRKMDVAVPPQRLATTVAELQEACAPGALHVFGHLAEANLHLNIAGAPDGAEAAVAHVVLAHGGTIASEHGVGSAKAAVLHDAQPPALRALTRAMKDAVDPQRVLNPGVMLPVT